MILTAIINDSLAAELELNFTTNTWNLPPAVAKWGGVMYSDRGLLEVKPWGVIWLMDGNGSGKKDCTVILHAAPTGDGGALAQDSGPGRVYAPAGGKFKDSEIQWRLLRRSPSPQLAASKASGATTPVRMRAKQIAEGLLPKAGKLTNGQPEANAIGTGCGEFPGRVLKRMPVLGPGQQGAFQLDVPGAGLLYLTSPTTHWEKFAQAIDRKYQPVRNTWVEFNGANRPRTGDIYVLSQFEKKSDFQHVGMIISADGNEWITADGGQGNGWQSGLITRKFYSTGQIDGERGNKAWLKGWVDLDNLRDVLRKWFPANV
jgi:hypothetical protein